MVFDSIFKKENQKPSEKRADFAQMPAQQAQKNVAKETFDKPGIDSDFEKDVMSPDNLLAEGLLEPEKNTPQEHISQKAIQKPMPLQASQKIPAFVSLDKYKEIRLALRDMKIASAEMRRTIESLRQNRDGGTALLNNTISGLERIEGNIDQIRNVLRT